jgi:hypothetical protein
MKKLVLVAAVCAAAVFPASSFAATFSGVVVGKSSGSLAVASKAGLVRTVRTTVRARLGARVRVSGSAVRIMGQAHRARIHGVVISRVGGTTFLAAGRSLLAVRSAGRRLASADGSGPSTGAVVNTTVGISGGQMTQQQMQVVGQSGAVTVQAAVTAVSPGSITVTVNGQPLVIPLPAGIQLPASLVGQSVTLTINLAQSGPTAQEDDQNEADDDDQGDDNNDQGNDNNDQGDDQNGGGGEGGGD